MTPFFFYLTAFVTVFLMTVSLSISRSLEATSDASAEDIVWLIGAWSIFSASTVFFIFFILQ